MKVIATNSGKENKAIIVENIIMKHQQLICLMNHHEGADRYVNTAENQEMKGRSDQAWQAYTVIAAHRCVEVNPVTTLNRSV